MTDNRQLFATTELEKWTTASGLLPEEAVLISSVLDSKGRTLEVGVGGGRVVAELLKRGFSDLYGIDFVPALVEHARQRVGGRVQLSMMEMQQLAFPDDMFRNVLCLQQVTCFIAMEDERLQAMREVYRVLYPGGRACFSFLLMDAQRLSFIRCLFARYMRALRAFSPDALSLQYQPWLRRRGSFNPSALLDRPPYVYWFTIPEALALLREAGFRIEWTGVGSTLRCDGLLQQPENRIVPRTADDKLYVVCSK